MQAGVHIGGRPKQIAALQRKPAACLFHEGTPAPSSGLHGGDISFRLHSSYVFTLRHRSAPGFIPGEKPLVSLVFPTEIEHYSCFRLYSGLRKISPRTPFPEGKHRKRGILNLQLFIFCQISGICYFQLLQGMAPYGSCATPKYSVCPTFSGQAPRREEWGLYLRKTERNSRKHCSKAPFPALETALRPTGKPGK